MAWYGADRVRQFVLSPLHGRKAPTPIDAAARAETARSALAHPALKLERAAACAHAIINHLTVIVGDCEIGLGEDLGAEASYRLGRIRREALKIEKLTEELLALTPARQERAANQ